MSFYCIHCRAEIDARFKACPHCGEQITDFLRRYLENPLDGKYRILSRLGVGGMGEVYKVLHIHLNAIRVIKLMRPNVASDLGANDRFLREARLATKINHPNVATLYDFSTLDDGSHYMVSEYIEGTNLHQVLEERGPLPPRYAAEIAVQALLGLDAIHRAGIIHRDISPENLMITRTEDGEERVKIIDLGIAKSTGADDEKTKTGIFVGKWKYCSPEHLGMLRPDERIDGRADLYSFGIVLYEMLAGVPPFQGDTPHAYLMMHSSQPPRALSEANPYAAIPPELEALLMRALEKDRTKRFATAREFARSLEAIIPDLTNDTALSTMKTAEMRLDPAMLPRDETALSAAGVAFDGNSPTVVTDELKTAPEVTEPLAEVEAAPQEPAEIAAPGEAPIEPAFSVQPIVRADAEPQEVPVPEERPRPRRMWAVAAALLLVVVAGAFVVARDRDGSDAPAEPVSVQAAAVPAAQVDAVAPGSASVTPGPSGHVGINAFPWAKVVRITNQDTGLDVDLGGDFVTPGSVDLAPGRYELTLSNPAYGPPVTRRILVSTGSEQVVTVVFGDPAAIAPREFGVQP